MGSTPQNLLYVYVCVHECARRPVADIGCVLTFNSTFKKYSIFLLIFRTLHAYKF